MESERRITCHEFPSREANSMVVLKQSGRRGPKNLESLVGDILCSRWCGSSRILSQGDVVGLQSRDSVEAVAM